MNLLLRFKEHIDQLKILSRDESLLLAVSGGVDSVVLCALCAKSGFDFVIAHCNFQLRGEESGRDEEFVKKLGTRYGKQVLVKRFDTYQYAGEHKCSTQVAARELRYGWFAEIVDGEGGIDKDGKRLHYVLTAHHADDNIETLLMNFFKGTGIAGLRGMLPRQGAIVRPLLAFHKKDLLEYAREQNLDWVEDSSNETDDYSRNYIRHHLMPVIEKIFPQAWDNLNDNLHRFIEIEVLYQQAIDTHKRKLIEHKGNEVHMPVLKIKKSTPARTILFEILKEYGFSPQQLPSIMALLDSETGKFVASGTHRLIRNRNWLVIAPVDPAQASMVLIEGPGKVEIPQGKILANKFDKQTDWKPTADKTVACLDARDIKFPLIVRSWKAGDYFYPLGMKKKKKLLRFLIDLKLSKTEKESVKLVEMDKKILWVIGHRIDERFKVSENTKEIIQIRLEPKD